MPDRQVTRTGDDYADAMMKLLPQGQAWPRQEGTALSKAVSGLAQIWGLVEQAAAKLLRVESDPRTTLDLLPDWERAFGLPDPCVAEPLTIGDRRVALLQRMTMDGAQSREFFIDLAAAIGYTITISEYRPFMVGVDRVGDNRTIGDGSGTQKDQFGINLVLNPAGVPISLGEYSEYPYILGPDTNRFYWTVHVGAVRLTWFRVSVGQVGVDPHLRIAIATDLECLIRRYAPAHTGVIFDYSGLITGGSMAGTP
jgi:uncharacterized protein YmfQ (DUF2313 family)